jgi:Flp pilus assembly protein TadD
VIRHARRHEPGSCRRGLRPTWTRLLSIVASLLASTACGLVRTPLQSPVTSGATWLEITSDHFVLYTDLESGKAHELARNLEAVRDALLQVAFSVGRGDEPRVSVVAFERRADYDALAPKATGGFAAAHLPLDIERHPTVVFADYDDARTRQTFVHEEVHELMHRSFGSSPTWLNEGLAEYFSVLRIENGHVVLGDPVPELMRFPLRLAPSTAQILHASPAAFTPDHDPRTSLRLYEGSWLLVHFLYSGPYRGRFEVFTDALSAGRPAEDAWRVAMAGLPQEQLEHDFREYVEVSSWPRFEKELEDRSPVTLVDRRMDAAEVHLLWARITVKAFPDQALASREIDEAAALEPESPEIAYARGCLAWARGEKSDAADAFRRALAGAPGDPRFLFGVALATGACGANPRAPNDSLCEALRVNARSPEENALAALYLFRNDRRDDAVRRAKAAFHADPRCEVCAGVLADMLAANGDLTGAIAVLERAVSISPETPLDQALVRRLERYRAVGVR